MIAGPSGDSRTPVLLSVNVGMPRDVPWQGKTVYTGVWKSPVEGPAMVRRLNIDGDGQGDKAGHGGEQRAVLVYQIDSYDYWQRHFARDDFEYGQFGENLTVAGLPDDEVCIGDRYRIGDAEFEVTQPRVTCYRVGLRMGEPELPALLVSHRRPGFYMRVLSEGHIRAGDEIEKTASGSPGLTVAATDALLYLPDREPATLRLALQIPALSPGWQGSFRDLLDQAEGNRLAAGPPAWEGFRGLRVTDIVHESATVSSIELAAIDGTALPAAHAGQYLTLRVAGAADPPPVRSYSLSSTTDAGTYRISVKREDPGSASGYLTTSLRPGAVIDTAAPRGEFILDDADRRPLLLISAGIGLTPVLAMLQQLVMRDRDREVWWIHGARGPTEHPLAAEAHTLLSGLPGAHEHIFYSGATPAERAAAHAVEGRLTYDSLVALGIPADAVAYVCGPDAFMTDIGSALAAAGIGSDRVHTERFSALPESNPGIRARSGRPPHPPEGDRETGPLVTFARSGISTKFGADGRSLLDLADACDVPTRWSCRTGVCHTCITPLLSGSVSYSPTPLESPADGQTLICCARPVTDVVLDM